MRQKNKIIKRISSFLYLICFCYIFCGCNAKQNVNLNNDNNQNSKLITVGVAQLGPEGAWRDANTESIKNSGSKENGINLIFEDGEGKQETQLKILESFIEKKVDVIVLVPCVEDGWDDILRKAQEANIPVMLVDRTIKTSDENLYKCWIGSDFLLEGYYAADWLNNYLVSSGKGNTTHNVGVLQGTMGASAEVGRTQGVTEMLSGNSNYNVVYQKSGNFSVDGGKKCMQEILDSNKNIDILISQNDDMSLGAIEVMESKGIKPGKDITIISFDGVKAAFEAMVKGKINCTIECNPLSGELVMETAKKLANGETVEKKVYVLEGLYTSETAKDYIDSRKY